MAGADRDRRSGASERLTARPTRLFRLDSVAAPLAERFREASSTKRREAAVVACRHAAGVVGLAGEEVRDAFAALASASAGDDRLRQQLERVALELDEQHFGFDESSDASAKQVGLQLFAKARAASALAFALSADSGELHEAIYEAIAAVDQPTELIGLVENALRA